MFLIFGLTPSMKDEGPVVQSHCRNCASRTSWHLHSETDWVSVFFVRLLPVRTTQALACRGCGSIVALSAAQNRLVRAGRPSDDAVIDGWINAAQGAGHATPATLRRRPRDRMD